MLWGERKQYLKLLQTMYYQKCLVSSKKNYEVYKETGKNAGNRNFLFSVRPVSDLTKTSR